MWIIYFKSHLVQINLPKYIHYLQLYLNLILLKLHHLWFIWHRRLVHQRNPLSKKSEKTNPDQQLLKVQIFKLFLIIDLASYGI